MSRMNEAPGTLGALIVLAVLGLACVGLVFLIFS